MSNIVPVEEYQVMTFDKKELMEVIQENLQGVALSPSDLDVIKVPGGGATMWTVPTLDGEEDVKELTGVIVYWQNRRGYWSQSIEETGGGTPPDCSSEDGVYGIGTPGGECAKCPLAEFGTAKNGQGKGQACKQNILLFLVTDGDVLPKVVKVPPTSIAGIRKYFIRLAGKGVRYYGVQTTLTLVKEKNDTYTYSKIEPKVAKVLSKEQMQFFKEYAESIKPALMQMKIEQSEFEG